MFPRHYRWTAAVLQPGPEQRAFRRFLVEEIFRPNLLLEMLESRGHH